MQSDEGILGRSYNWDGTDRMASVSDMEKKYSKLPSDHLVRLLNRLVTSSTEEYSTAPPTLLQPVQCFAGDKYPQNSGRRAAVLYMRELCNLQEIRSKIEKILEDLKGIHTRIEEATVRAAIAPTAVELDDFDNFDPLAESVVYKQSPVVQKTNSDMLLATLSRNERSLQQSLEQLRLEEAAAVSSFEKSKSSLLQEEALVAPISRHPIHWNPLDWLGSRALGASSSHQGIGSALGFSASTSSVGSNRSIACRFRFLWQSTGHTLELYSAVFDKSGRFVITGADDYLVKMWDVETGNLVNTYRGHRAEITLVAVSQDNSLVASSCLDKTIRVWRMRDGMCLKVLQHNGKVNSIAFDQHTNALVSGTDGGVCYVWDLSVELSDNIDSIPLLDALTERYKVKSQYMLSTTSSSSLVDMSLDQTIDETTPTTVMSSSSSDSVVLDCDETSSSSFVNIEVPVTLPTDLNSMGLFNWSRSNARDGPLMLEIVTVENDGNQTKIDVDCLDVSPAGMYY